MSDPGPRKKALPILGSNAMPTAARAPGEKRRLPMLPKVEVAEEGDEDRPAWHWSGVGAVAIFLSWLPLASLTNGPLRRLLEGSDDGAPSARMIGLNVAAFALACFGGGFLVGRFGGRAGLKEATACGLAAAVIAWALAAISGRGSGILIWALLLAVLAAIGAGASRGGGKLGLSKR